MRRSIKNKQTKCWKKHHHCQGHGCQRRLLLFFHVSTNSPETSWQVKHREMLTKWDSSIHKQEAFHVFIVFLLTAEECLWNQNLRKRQHLGNCIDIMFLNLSILTNWCPAEHLQCRVQGGGRFLWPLDTGHNPWAKPKRDRDGFEQMIA